MKLELNQMAESEFSGDAKIEYTLTVQVTAKSISECMDGVTQAAGAALKMRIGAVQTAPIAIPPQKVTDPNTLQKVDEAINKVHPNLGMEKNASIVETPVVENPHKAENTKPKRTPGRPRKDPTNEKDSSEENNESRAEKRQEVVDQDPAIDVQASSANEIHSGSDHPKTGPESLSPQYKTPTEIVQALAVKKGLPAAHAILKQFGIGKARELPAEEHDAFFAACLEAMA